jgi:hypothetical protein
MEGCPFNARETVPAVMFRLWAMSVMVGVDANCANVCMNVAKKYLAPKNSS